MNHPADWMETDSRVVCPDPACQLIMRIERTTTRTLRHDDVGPTPWDDVKNCALLWYTLGAARIVHS